MYEPSLTDALSPQAIEAFSTLDLSMPHLAYAKPHTEMNEESLPFTVRLVQDKTALNKAVSVRHSAYARHVPDFAQSLKTAETSDSENGVAVVLAESKLDGSPLGTMRIQTNRFKPLGLEASLPLPGWLHNSTLAEAVRLGVTNGKAGRMVKVALFKAFFQYCQREKIEWMVITARTPIDRQYERLLFEDVYPGIGYVPMSHVNNIPHRVMSFNIGTAEERWEANQHPLYDFFCKTYHPDIDITGGLPASAVLFPTETRHLVSAMTL